jgi:two-component system NtrC family sensor kinase
MKVLIVEDNRDHQFIIKKKLEDYHERIDIDAVETVDEARRRIEAGTYDTVLLDYRLEGSSGIELVKWLQQSGIDVPVIMITNMEDVSLAVQAVKLGVYDYLCKNKESLDRLPVLIDKATEEYDLKKKLKDTEFRYRTLVEGINEAVFLMNRTYEVLYISSSVERLFGCSEEEGRKNFHSLFSDRGWQLFKKNCSSVLEGSRVEPFVLMMRQSNGNTLLAEINASRYEQKNANAGIIGTIQDVTKRVLLERELNAEREETRKVNNKLRMAISDLKRTQEQLVQSEKIAAVGQLVSGVAHELNNPLFSAMGNTELLIMDGSEGGKDREKLEKILDAINRARLIVRELIQFSQGETIDKEYLPINELIRRILQRMEHDLKHQNVHVETDLTENLPTCFGSSVGLQRVFINILKNAQQALEEVDEGRAVRIRTYQDGNKAHVFVDIANNGPEIPGDVISSIFDPFYTTREVGKGTGLGLSTAYGVVKEHEGDLTVQSSPEWTTFTIRLPAQVEAAPEFKPLRERKIEVEVTGAGETVLVVESEPIIRNLLGDFFKKKGFVVKSAASGKQARRILEDGAVSTLVIDDHLPDIRGKTLVDELRKKKRVFADRSLILVENGISSGVKEASTGSDVRLLRKPFSLDELIQAISPGQA